MHGRTLATIAIGAWLLCGCATNSVTGKTHLALVPAQTVAAEGDAAYSNDIQQLQSLGRISSDPVTNERVQRITDHLVSQAIVMRPDAANWHWRVNVIDEPTTVNAFCAPGGGMAIYSGLLGLGLTDDEVAQVMAHEVSHALLDHGQQKQSVGILAAVLQVAIAATGQTQFDQDMRRSGAELATTLLMELPNSRGDEAEADAVGIKLAAQAGFDPQAAVSLWSKMAAHAGSGSSRFDWFKTHPANPKRIEALSAQVASLTPVYLAARGNVGADPNARVMAQQSDGGGPSGPMSCASGSAIVRAQCLGVVQMGMSSDEIAGALGPAEERDLIGHVVRYNDRFLTFDSANRLVAISVERPK